MGYYENKREETLEKLFRITTYILICVFLVLMLVPFFFTELFTFTEGAFHRFEWIIRVIAFFVRSGVVPLCIIYQIFYIVHRFFRKK